MVSLSADHAGHLVKIRSNEAGPGDSAMIPAAIIPLYAVEFIHLSCIAQPNRIAMSPRCVERSKTGGRRKRTRKDFSETYEAIILMLHVLFHRRTRAS